MGFRNEIDEEFERKEKEALERRAKVQTIANYIPKIMVISLVIK